MCVRLIPAHAGKTFAQRDQPSPGPAHPRSRGENPSLPPLFRLIPAHAGKTCGGRTRRRQAAAHPRSRGENCVISRSPRLAAGSSPLTRGKLQRRVNPELKPRLIPAHAGKTSGRPSPTGAAAAHPRSRGENTDLQRICDALGGSSPLTRGKPLDAPPDRPVAGLIPAHAGKTAPLNLPWGPTGAHPRSRGENTPDV